MADITELLVQCFACCVNALRLARTRAGGGGGDQQQQQQQHQHRRRRIDRSMIGMPTNFRHTAHISSGDVDMSISQLANLQAQMQRKGGYDTNIGAKGC